MGLFSRKKPPQPELPAPAPSTVPCQVCDQPVREGLMDAHRRGHFELIRDTGHQARGEADAYRGDPAAKPRHTAVYRIRSQRLRGMETEIALVAAYLARSYPRDAAFHYLPTRHYNCGYEDIGNGDLVAEVLVIVHY